MITSTAKALSSASQFVIELKKATFAPESLIEEFHRSGLKLSADQLAECLQTCLHGVLAELKAGGDGSGHISRNAA